MDVWESGICAYLWIGGMYMQHGGVMIVCESYIQVYLYVDSIYV